MCPQSPFMDLFYRYKNLKFRPTDFDSSIFFALFLGAFYSTL